MNIIKYLYWFFCFSQSIFKPKKRIVYTNVFFKTTKEFLSVFVFLIPIKIIIIMNKPDLFEDFIFFENTISANEIAYISIFIFIIFILILFILEIRIVIIDSRLSAELWVLKKDICNSRTKFKNLLTSLTDSISYFLVIILGIGLIVYLNIYFLLPIFFSLIISSAFFLFLIKQDKSSLLLKSYFNLSHN